MGKILNRVQRGELVRRKPVRHPCHIEQRPRGRLVERRDFERPLQRLALVVRYAVRHPSERPYRVGEVGLVFD